MADGVKRRRKSSQKGVQAVFTSDTRWKERSLLGVGLFWISIGAVAWTWATGILGGRLYGYGEPSPSSSLILISISIPLLVGGVSICTYYLAMRRTWRASNRIESALYELEALMSQKNGGPILPLSSESRRAPKPSMRKFFAGVLPKALAVAVMEGVLLIAIYGGIVQEYVSNTNLQNWVHSNFALGGYFLNYNAVLVTGGLLGALISQFVPRKPDSKRLQK